MRQEPRPRAVSGGLLITAVDRAHDSELDGLGLERVADAAQAAAPSD